MEFQHKSVLLDETITNLNIRPDGIYVDGTLGGGGHSLEIAKRLTDGRLIGIDQDADAIAAATERLKEQMEKVTIVRSNYSNMKDELGASWNWKGGWDPVGSGRIILSLDTPERGFTYREEDAPLDMLEGPASADDGGRYCKWIHESELYRIIRDFGEDRFAKNIAKHIVTAREKKRILTTGELTEIIRGAIPMKVQKSGGHPAKRTFQAIRIELNQELEVLKNTLDDMIELLNPGGRLCVITFHSLEDRIVKTIFKKNENPCTCPSDFPVCVCGKVSKGRMVSRKPILPSEEELVENSRAKSAKLRVFERK